MVYGTVVESAKKNSLNEEFISSNNYPKNVWRNINSIIPNTKKNNKSKIYLKDSDGNNSEDNKTADYINKFFSNIGPQLGKVSELDIGELEIKKIEVRKLINDIDITKSSGIDKILSKCLKDALLSLNSQLTHIFEMSLKFGMFPDSWKIATVVPLFKNGKKWENSNFRPVSLLSIPGKILKKIIHGHVIFLKIKIV